MDFLDNIFSKNLKALKRSLTKFLSLYFFKPKAFKIKAEKNFFYNVALERLQLFFMFCKPLFKKPHYLNCFRSKQQNIGRPADPENSNISVSIGLKEAIEELDKC